MSNQFGSPKQVTDANQRADELFRACLTPAQRRQWEAKKYLVIRGNVTGRLYLLVPAQHAWVLDQFGQLIGFRCFIPVIYNMPSMDKMLIRKLLLENRENYFLEQTILTRYCLATAGTYTLP